MADAQAMLTKVGNSEHKLSNILYFKNFDKSAKIDDGNNNHLTISCFFYPSLRKSVLSCLEISPIKVIKAYS